MRRIPVAITTSAGGAFDQKFGPLSGLFHGVYCKDTDMDDTADIAITEAETGMALVTVTNFAADALYMPRSGTHTTAGAASLYAAGGTAVGERIPVSGEIRVVVAQGGASKTATLYLYVD